jgi:hypothetical protein
MTISDSTKAQAARHLKAAAQPAGRGAAEALKCVALGLRDGLKARVAFISLGIWLGSIALWLTVFFKWHEALAARLTPGLNWLWHSTTGKALPAGHTLDKVAVVLVVLALLLACLLTVQVAVEMILMKRIQQQCLRHYPTLEVLDTGSGLRNLRESVGMMGSLLMSAPLAFIPVLGALFIAAVGAYANTRNLVNDALDGVAREHERQAVVRHNRSAMVVLGMCSSALTLVPLAGLFVPSIMGAAACHFSMRQVLRLRQAAALG